MVEDAQVAECRSESGSSFVLRIYICFAVSLVNFNPQLPLPSAIIRDLCVKEEAFYSY